MIALSYASADPPHPLEEDFRLLKETVQAAGKLAYSYFRKDLAVQLKLDGTEVSEADLAVDTLLKSMLLGGRPNYGWLSEETEDDPNRLEQRSVWMVDPIDGTNAFVRHIPEWTISAALVQEGKPVLGAVFNPATNEFFHAIRGGGAFLNDAPIKVSRRGMLEGALFIASGGLFKKRIWKEPWPGVESQWVNSVAYRLSLVAAGRADATVSLSAKCEWDLAAGVLLIEEAGGLVTDHRGHAFRFNLPIPRFPSLVAAPPELHAELIKRTSRVDL
ncbi:MAG TPA: 3'(2'),5'-bisphosphate nucleotidase CysQ [Methyloceanibacter sp.]|nr:3'(2'),5'-bisphosphate nucleotidase CysQ [Methyloceanibacter sp.]